MAVKLPDFKELLLYFQYQTEAVPHRMSLQAFCSKNNVPYNIFHKWYKDTHRKIVEVQVNGVPQVQYRSPCRLLFQGEKL